MNNIAWLVNNLCHNNFWSKTAWPPSSPDLNPLDSSVWSVLEAAASAKPAKSRQDLIQKIKEAWDKVITEEYVVKTCASFPRRLRAVIDASGGHIEGLKKKKEDKEDEEEDADDS